MIKKWNEKLEKMFEANTSDLSLIESRESFELNSNNSSLENLSYVHSARLDKNCIHSVFTQLSPFFEIGFLFERQNNQGFAIDAFAFGEPIDLRSMTLNLKLPKTELFNIAKTSAEALLKKLNFSYLNPQKKMNAFVISISASFSILVVTELAEPWLKLRLEALQSTLMKIHFE